MRTVEPRYSTKAGHEGEIISYSGIAYLGFNGRKDVTKHITIKMSEVAASLGREPTPKKAQAEALRLANEKERQLRKEFERGNIRNDKEKITLAQFIDRHYLPEHCKKTLKPNSYLTTRSHLIAAREYFGRAKLREIDVVHVNQFHVWLQDQRQEDGSKYSDKTIWHKWYALSFCLDYAVSIKYIEYNPCKLVMKSDKPHLKKNIVKVLETEEVYAFVRVVDKQHLRWQALFYTLLRTGLRRGECIGLQWGDVQFSNRRIYIHRSVTGIFAKDIPETYHIGGTKTEVDRYVPIPPDLAQVLHDFKAEEDSHFPTKDTDFLFHSPKSREIPLCVTSPDRKLQRLIKKYNLPPITLHELRRTFSTEGARLTDNIKLVSEINGHANMETTYTHYIATREDDRYTLTAQIAESLTPPEKRTVQPQPPKAKKLRIKRKKAEN